VVRREQRTHGDRLINAVEGLSGEVGIQQNALVALCGMADLGHLNHGLQRVLASRGLGRQHHGVGAV
jgi:hypothetical protein